MGLPSSSPPEKLTATPGAQVRSTWKPNSDPGSAATRDFPSCLGRRLSLEVTRSRSNASGQCNPAAVEDTTGLGKDLYCSPAIPLRVLRSASVGFGASKCNDIENH